MFLTAREVEESLVREELDKVMAWCHDNKSRLRKLKSSLEFQVRLQEYLELVKRGQKLEAVKHAKKFLCTETELEHLAVVQQAMGLLAFSSSTQIQPYKDLLDKSRWQSLIEQFRLENFRLHQLSAQCTFTVALQSGLAALKTPQCYKHNFVLSGRNSNSRDINVACCMFRPAQPRLPAGLSFTPVASSHVWRLREEPRMSG